MQILSQTEGVFVRHDLFIVRHNLFIVRHDLFIVR